MINFIIKNSLKKIAIKLATDKSLRNKVVNGVKKANSLNSEGKLLKTLGKSAGRIKRKIKL
mgnify:CR=1 FL=1